MNKPEVRRFTLQDVFKSRFGIGAALMIGRLVPPAAGKPLALAIANKLSKQRDSSIVKGLRTNHWVASGCTMSREELDEDVNETLRMHALCLYEFYHNLNRLTFAKRRVLYPPIVQEFIDRNGKAGQGLVICGVHLSNYDLALHSAGRLGARGLALSAPSPGGGYRWQNKMRRQSGIDIIPASMDSVRLAVRRLQAGELVGTGVDWPVNNSKYRPSFFGRPTHLSVFHVQLALMAKVPVVVLAATRRPDGIYEVVSTEPIEMQSYPNHRAEIIDNTEMVLSIAEGYIRSALRQWVMFYPLWPELSDSTP